MSEDRQAEQATELARFHARVGELLQGRRVHTMGNTGELPPAAAPGAADAVDCVFLGFYWSRMTRDEQDAFLVELRARTGADTLLVMLDDTYVEGVSPTVARTDAQGNTYYRVAGPDGTLVEMTKNYPSDSALRKRLGSAAREIRIERSAYYWLLTCRLK